LEAPPAGLIVKVAVTVSPLCDPQILIGLEDGKVGEGCDLVTAFVVTCEYPQALMTVVAVTVP